MWTVRDACERAILDLSRALRVPPLVARCLVARGFSDVETAQRFLSPKLGALRPPAGLAGLDAALERIIRAINAGERIGCFGDYDVDGITTCTVLTGFLRAVGATVSPRVAHRDTGYGLSVKDVDRFVAERVTILITGDCGTSDIEAITHARTNGIDVIVLDHHTVPEAVAAHPAHALVNPFRADSQFAFRGLASVGLAFYFIAALRTALAQKGRGSLPDPRSWLDLVAVGTIADLVPLTDENRILTAQGLRTLAERPRPGIEALLQLARVERSQIDERTVSWKLGPRINAPGRLGDAGPALELLLADSMTLATAAAGAIEQANDTRRAEQERVLAEAEAMLPEELGPCVVVAGVGWPHGVVGIVAAKLVDKTGRPAFVIAIDPAQGIGRGSARTARGVNLYQALHQCAPLLVRYGGHAAAAGLTVAAEHIEALTQALAETVQGMVAEADDKSLFVEAEVRLDDVTLETAQTLLSLAPFGRGNAEPLLGTRGLKVRESRRVGDRSHLKLLLEAADGTFRTAIGFGMGERDPGPGATVDCAYVPIVNRYGGRTSVELELRFLDRV